MKMGEGFGVRARLFLVKHVVANWEKPSRAMTALFRVYAVPC